MFTILILYFFFFFDRPRPTSYQAPPPMLSMDMPGLLAPGSALANPPGSSCRMQDPPRACGSGIAHPQLQVPFPILRYLLVLCQQPSCSRLKLGREVGVGPATSSPCIPSPLHPYPLWRATGTNSSVKQGVEVNRDRARERFHHPGNVGLETRSQRLKVDTCDNITDRDPVCC